jgi:hypothetical protein
LLRCMDQASERSRSAVVWIFTMASGHIRGLTGLPRIKPLQLRAAPLGSLTPRELVSLRFCSDRKRVRLCCILREGSPGVFLFTPVDENENDGICLRTIELRHCSYGLR